MKKLMLLLIAGIIAMSSCKKETVEPVDPNDQNPPVVTNRIFSNVNTSVAGLVLDKYDNAIEGALVSFGQKTAMTDANGVFKIDNATVKENRAFVKVSKDGYFHGSRTYFAHEGQLEHVRIKLLEKVLVGSINSNGGTVTTSKGVKLEFPSDAVVDADGNPYTDIVDIALQYLDPEADDINFIMPGDLRGATTENVENGLTSYGMVAVELLGSGGEVLNVADGKTVQLTMPVANSQMSSAPAEIPLWFFDEEDGIWREEGSATLQGDEYVGEVSHFTFWNCDINWDLVYIEGVIMVEGTPLVNAGVQLSFENADGSFVAWDYTNSSGIYSGQVPLNTVFSLNVYPPDFSCATPLFTQEIGPFTADEIVATINIDPSLLSNLSMSITGNIQDCDGNPVADGYVKVTTGETEHYGYATDGMVDFTILNCNSIPEIEIIAVDNEGLTQSTPQTFPYSNTVDFGTLQACVALDEFIIYEFDGGTYTFTENIGVYDSLGYKSLVGQTDFQNYFSLEFDANGTGTFDALNVFISNSSHVYTPNYSDFEVTITQYTNVPGETIQGTFEGTAINSTSNYPISGSFRAIIE